MLVVQYNSAPSTQPPSEPWPLVRRYFCNSGGMSGIIKSMKFSANVPDDVIAYMDKQVSEGHFPSRSAALTEAMTLWRLHRLHASYAEAFSDRDDDEDALWDSAVADGLTPENTP
jgi:Arc/MetJ-type ribon-helix-helix transcriptional regulator